MPATTLSPVWDALLLDLKALLGRHGAILKPHDVGTLLEIDEGLSSICFDNLLRQWVDSGRYRKPRKLKFKKTKIGLRVKFRDEHKTKIVLPFNLWDAVEAAEGEWAADGTSRYRLAEEEGPWAVMIGIAESSGGTYYLTELGERVKAHMPPSPPAVTLAEQIVDSILENLRSCGGVSSEELELDVQWRGIRQEWTDLVAECLDDVDPAREI